MEHRPRQHQWRKKLTNEQRFLSAIVLATAIFSSGCSEPAKAPVPAPVAPKSPAPISIAPQGAQTITPSVTAKAELPAGGIKSVESTYTYRPGGRRDPFAPIIVREEKKEKRAAASPLERYAVTEFKLTGIIWGGFGYNAMIEGPDGKGYFVRTGTILGENRGVIRKITKDSLVVEEKYKNYMGVTERKQITITLRKSQEGLP